MTTITPPICAISTRFASSAPPIALALNPSATKITLNPITNATAWSTVCARAGAVGRALQILQALAGQQGEVCRHEREDARRHEGNEAR